MPRPAKDLQNYLASTVIGEESIREARLRIQQDLMAGSQWIRQADFQALSRSDVLELVFACDARFLEGHVARCLEAPGMSLRTRLSSRMTSTGGTTSARKRILRGEPVQEYEIAVSSALLFNTNFGEGTVRVAGLPVASRLDALHRIVEHELVHLAEMVAWGDSSCGRPRFRRIAQNLFGHLESNHQLMTFTQAARERFEIAPGDAVEFHFRGKRLQGTVNRIGKRVTVLVPDPAGERCTDGGTYLRYCIPPRALLKAGSPPAPSRALQSRTTHAD